MNAWYYLPEIGRFISPDTIVPEPENPQSYNRYSYVHNNPVNYTDPAGHVDDAGSQFGGSVNEIVSSSPVLGYVYTLIAIPFTPNTVVLGIATGMGEVAGTLPVVGPSVDTVINLVVNAYDIGRLSSEFPTLFDARFDSSGFYIVAYPR